MLSDRVKKWLRARLEKWAGTFYEGPEPPDRFRDHAVFFANLNPRATREEWVEFATELARETYSAGYMRGYEASEREQDEDDGNTQLPPDLIADRLDPDWRNSDAVVLDFPDAIVPESVGEADLIREQIALVNRGRRF